MSLLYPNIAVTHPWQRLLLSPSPSQVAGWALLSNPSTLLCYTDGPLVSLFLWGIFPFSPSAFRPFWVFSLWELQQVQKQSPRPWRPKRDHAKQNKSDQCNAISSISFPTRRVLDLFCLPPLSLSAPPFLHVGCSAVAHPVSWRRTLPLLPIPFFLGVPHRREEEEEGAEGGGRGVRRVWRRDLHAVSWRFPAVKDREPLSSKSRASGSLLLLLLLLRIGIYFFPLSCRLLSSAALRIC